MWAMGTRAPPLLPLMIIGPWYPIQFVTLLHKCARHLDVRLFGWSDTPHTRGSCWRVDALVRLALGTLAETRKPLVWIKAGPRWRIDRSKLR
jgi:hypothetical protein